MYFEQLQQLASHISGLQDVLGTKDIFVVGGAVRDILLGITRDPTDIDLTLAANPETLRQHIEKNETNMSIFRTDKYGTMTLIDKQEEKQYEYEITPFRTEGVYSDVRHPDDITRSDSLLTDSQRRDFTINTLYLYTTPFPKNKATKDLKDEKFSTTLLSKYPNLYLADTATLILQDHDSIKKLFKGGCFHEQHLLPALEQAHKINLGKDNICSSLSILIDPHHGLIDLFQRNIRAVGDPNKRFTEDALRILRGVRFPIILNQHLPERHKQNTGFIFEKATRTSMCEHAHLVKHLAKERIHEELVKVFTENNPFGYIALLDELGLIETLFPALAACKNNEQPTLYHPFDTYTHTLLSLHALQQLTEYKRTNTQNKATDGKSNKENDNFKQQEDTLGDLKQTEKEDGRLKTNKHLPKLAMLYHDVGKPAQYDYISEQVTKNPDDIDMSDYEHHTITGGEMAKQDFQQLGFSKKEIEEIIWYIRRHHRPGEILESQEKNRNKKLRQLLSEGGLERVLNLMDICIADRLGQYNPLQSAAIEQLYEMKMNIIQLHAEEGRFTLQDLAINGTILMQEFSIPAGPKLGEFLQKAFDRVLGDIKKRNNKKAILDQLKSLDS